MISEDRAKLGPWNSGRKRSSIAANDRQSNACLEIRLADCQGNHGYDALLPTVLTKCVIWACARSIVLLEHSKDFLASELV